MGCIMSRFASGWQNSSSKTKIDDLPIDCLEHIFSFCNLMQVFRCMSVSREWNKAARSTVSRRKRLSLRDDDLRDDETDIILDNIRYTTIKEKGMMEQMLQSLSLMQCLTELYISSLPDDKIHNRFANSIILNNSSTLKEAVVMELPVRNGVVYPQLTILDCVFWRRNVVAVCPRLEKLNVYLQEVVTLRLLSSERINSLHLIIDPKLIIGGSPALVVELQKFQHLTELRIKVRSDLHLHDWEWQAPTLPLLKLFSSYTSLEYIFIESEVPIWANMDSYVDVLVSKSPRLRFVFLFIDGTTMTDASLLALSRLTDLHCLYLYPHLTADFTTAGILSLLRGRSRSKLHNVCIDHTHLIDTTVIAAELMSVSEETGRVVLEMGDRMVRRLVDKQFNLKLSRSHCCADYWCD